MYFTKKKLYFFYQYNYSLYIRIHIYLWFKHTQNSCPKLASQGVPKLKYKYEKKKITQKGNKKQEKVKATWQENRRNF